MVKRAEARGQMLHHPPDTRVLPQRLGCHQPDRQRGQGDERRQPPYVALLPNVQQTPLDEVLRQELAVLAPGGQGRFSTAQTGQ